MDANSSGRGAKRIDALPAKSSTRGRATEAMRMKPIARRIELAGITQF
jgi:hypothetical protein